MSFLPEEDQEFLENKGIKYELLTEKMPDGTDRRGVLFPAFLFAGNLRVRQPDGSLLVCESCDLLVMVPAGYATTKLDSFYTYPRLKRPNGGDPQAANGETGMFQKTWQFWSRHLDDKEWRAGIDGLRTYLSYIRAEFKIA